MVHMIVITKVSAGEASEQRDYESWSCALVPMSDDGVWSVDAPCVAHTSVVVLPADSEEYKKFVEMWLGAIFCSGVWKLLSTMGQEESQTNFIGMAQCLLQSCSDITAEKAPCTLLPALAECSEGVHCSPWSCVGQARCLRAIRCPVCLAKQRNL